MLYLLDRRGGLTEVTHTDGELLAQALMRRGIPPTSVVAFRNHNETIVPDDAPLYADDLYTARLIEGYDIQGVLRLFDHELAPTADVAGAPAPSHVLLDRRLRLDVTGAVEMKRHGLDGLGVVAKVESTVRDLIARHELAPAGSTVVVGLSGGVDSGSLLMMLARWCDEMGPDAAPRLVAATFQDFDSRYPGAFDSAARLAANLGVEHHVLAPDSAEQAFHLNRPIADILAELMATDDAHTAMYVDHHTTRRVLEVFSDDYPEARIALGLHATDLVAGLLNAATTAHEVGSIPRRRVGPYEYVMPLCVVPKRELHIFHSTITGQVPVQTTPNQWEFNPTDRNFYYFLADHLQWQWPGIQHWLFATLRELATESEFNTCGNCGSAVRRLARADPFDGVCDVCRVLDKYGWLTGTG